MGVLTGTHHVEKVKREIAKAGYGGKKVVLLAVSNFPSLSALANASASLFRRVDMEVDLVSNE